MISIKIATAHSAISADVRQNGEHVRGLMKQAHESGARIIHFSEGALSGYVKSQIKDWRHVDWRLLLEELDAVARLAGDLRLWVVLGSNHRLTPPHRPHNSLYVISEQGALIGRYDKRLCSNTEINDWYTPGFEQFVFEIDGLRFGCALCIEVHFPEIFDAYRRSGVDCVLLSAYTDDPMYGVIGQGHAAINNIWLSLATPTNPSTAVRSLLLGPDGNVLGRTEAGRASVITTVIDTKDARWEIPLRRARPWRTSARAGEIYRAQRVEDPRSDDKTRF